MRPADRDGPLEGLGRLARRTAANPRRLQQPRARPVDRAVDDEPVQPWCERALVPVGVERANGAEERLEHDLLGRRVVEDDEVRRAERARPVGAKEALEVGDRPRLGGLERRLLVPVEECHRLADRTGAPRTRDAGAACGNRREAP